METITADSALCILDQYRSQVEQLAVPDISEYATKTDFTFPISPYVALIKLEHIKARVEAIRQEIKQAKGKSVTYVIQQCDEFINTTLDERIFIARKLLESFTMQFDPPKSATTELLPKDLETRRESTTQELPSDELASLRRRLLAGGRTDSLAGSDPSVSPLELNQHHELLQENILSELVDLTSSLKSLALNFSNSLLNQDMSLLNDTSEAMIKNTSLFKTIDQNLNQYLQNKTGGKISVMFLLKMVAALLLMFLAIVLLIKVVPQF